MAQLHDSPAEYLRLMRKAVPLYDRLQDEVVRASSVVHATNILDLGAGTGETARRCLVAHQGARAVLVDASAAMLELAGDTLGPAAEMRIARRSAGFRAEVRWADADLAVLAGFLD